MLLKIIEMDISYFSNEIENLKSKNNFRVLRNLEHESNFVKENGQRMLNLSSNDYLGLAGDFQLREEFLGSFMSGAFGSSSSRLLTGNHKAYNELEDLLTNTYKREAALVFNSGYHANIGILPALAGKKDVIIADKLVHASIIDGLILSGAQIARYRHNDYTHLENLLKKYSPVCRNIFIVTESIFSMDGDLADLHKLVELKKQYKAFLYVDEAHAVGVRGVHGLGLAEEYNLINDIDFIIGTFGKAYASHGAYVICDSLFRDYLINKMRSLIFTTALPPIVVEWTKFIFEKTLNMHDKRNTLLELSDNLSSGLKNKGFITNTGSQIVPLIVGDNIKSIQLSELLCKKGFYVLPVRPPTVPEGTARLRFSLTATISAQDIENILCVFTK
jgi:8-amino-7-oxononanoate synthase